MLPGQRPMVEEDGDGDDAAGQRVWRSIGTGCLRLKRHSRAGGVLKDQSVFESFGLFPEEIHRQLSGHTPLAVGQAAFLVLVRGFSRTGACTGKDPKHLK